MLKVDSSNIRCIIGRQFRAVVRGSEGFLSGDRPKQGKLIASKRHSDISTRNKSSSLKGSCQDGDHRFILSIRQRNHSDRT
ncbi:hypothetical protein [Anabaena azotica]|uniref:Uncharacterized protein n=1 Tax=Anabaena azotica FACHB-119 TaxID=947527 RepID=A0ABR8DAQ8_9NOST|nr:hypothetical protein [Anabaena azotica]MBD2503719.1 hypothetical protein [Anabaena azotica FACHB-119]